MVGSSAFSYPGKLTTEAKLKLEQGRETWSLRRSQGSYKELEARLSSSQNVTYKIGQSSVPGTVSLRGLQENSGSEICFISRPS